MRSFIFAAVGVIALVAGGVVYVASDELRGFALAVVAIAGLLILLSIAFSPRATARLLTGRRGRYGTNAAIMTVSVLAIAVLVNLMMFHNPTRIDLTATRFFTLAPQTSAVLGNLDSTVRATAFFNPAARTQARAKLRAENLLNEFSRRSNKFEYRFEDPDLNPALAERYDVTRSPTIVFEDVKSGTQQSLPCFSAPNCVNFREQEFVAGIKIVTGEERKVVYLLAGHGERTVTSDLATLQIGDEGYDLAIAGLQRDNYDVRSIDLVQEEGGRVPEDAAVLVIAGPRKDPTPGEKQALTDFLLDGGRVVALLDPGTPRSFAELFEPWGVTLGRESIADSASSVAGQLLTPVVQRANGQFISRPDIAITEDLDVTFFPGVTSIHLAVPPEDMPHYIQVMTLAVTTGVSWLEPDVGNVKPDPENKRSGPFSVASVVVASGTLAKDPQELDYPSPAKIVVFGDSDFAKNRFFSSRDNADLFLNAVNWLAEDYELISIRTKLFPFRELVITTRERNVIKWTSWLGPPSAMLLLGLFVWWRRR